ncbi:MAG: SpaA isopeptide-forming pilin-related protein [Muricomes sp.]
MQGEVLLSATKKIPTVSSSAKLVAYGDATLQDIVTGVENTGEVKAYLNVKIPYGHLQIVKTSEDGVVEGLKFQITGNGVDQTVITGKDGTMKVENLNPGTYTVKELAENRYEPKKEQKVTVKGGETARVEFSNILKRGDLKVVKSSEDKLVEGVKFHLYGTALSGATVDEYAVTDKNGVATFSKILVSGGIPYTLEEVDTAVRYVVPQKQNVTIKWNEVTNSTVTNMLKKFRITVKKSDVETGTSQGDATLAGAVYGIYNGDTLVDTYTTDAAGRFTTKYYICGDNWTLREISPSEGYLLDERAHHVGAEAKSYTVERSTTANDVTEQVIKGHISIIKHADDGSTKIETPEKGAEFQVYLKQSGSYEQAKQSERDTLVCDENGYAQTRELPYGIYTVHQTKGWEGRELIADFDVYISKNGGVYRYLINNSIFKSYIKVVKKDAETGNIIPLSGAGFQIYDEAGTLVTMKYTYPEVTTIDTFYTNSEGYLITPEVLPYGTYKLVEVQAPYGYVLDGTSIPFTVAQENSSEESGVTVVAVEKKDMPQKGKIKIHKSGEDFTSVQISGDDAINKEGNLTEGETIYTPVYNIIGQAGAVYEIVALTDIVTPDGTLRASAGDVLDTLTTDKEGNAESKELYLGKYKVVEKTAPEGMVLNTIPNEVELIYAGQETSVTGIETSFYNERQKVQVDLDKALEQDEIFDVEKKGEIQNVAFGLYAAEELKAADDSVIPLDGLMEVVYCNTEGRAAFTSDLPFGKYYVKEITTDQHYLLSNQKYLLEFSYQGQEAALIVIHPNEGNAIENKLIRGSISGLKVDTEGKALEGAKMGLFWAGTKEFTEEKALLVSISEKDGAFSFQDVPYGDYIVREIASPKGYVLNEVLHHVSVTAHKEVIEVKIINKLIKGSVRLTKVDAEYPANKLTGAVFELYQDTDGDKKFNGNKDKLFGEIPETATGIYQKDELLYGGYFVKEKTAPKGFILDENPHFFEVTENGKTVDVENKAGVGFINRPITGNLELTKKDVVDGKLLPNARFRIKDEKGNIIVTGGTDKKGLATFTLRYGKYTYQEYEAPEGYEIDEKEYPFEIKENGQVIKATMTNEKKPGEQISTPKTGDDRKVELWIVLSALSAAGLTAFGALAIKAKKED